MKVALAAAVAILLSAASASPQPVDLSRLPETRDFRARRSSSNNADWSSNDDSKRPIPGETVTLADLTGPGVVTHIWLTVAANEYGWPRLLRLRAYYDGSRVPSVDAPIGDFFAVGHGFERPVESLVIRASSEGRSRNSYWPMPFRKSCRITVTNEGRRRVSNLYYHVDWKKVPSLLPGAAYFHARYRQALPASGPQPYEVLEVHGRGHYVGTVLSVVQAEAGWFGEGDDFFYVDGEKKPSIEGTGTEDYFNDAWGLRVDSGPYAGASVAEGTGLGSRMTAYRWHLADPIPFAKSLRFVFEHRGWTFNADGSVKSASGERTVVWMLDRALVGLCALQVGVCEEAVRLAAEYTSQRVQFGRPLSTFQGAQLRAADGYIGTEAIRVTMLQAAWKLDVGRDAAADVLAAKWWASQAGQEVVHITQHLHGGMGADIDYPVHRYFLWGKQIEDTLGGASAQLARLGATLAEASA